MMKLDIEQADTLIENDFLKNEFPKKEWGRDMNATKVVVNEEPASQWARAVSPRNLFSLAWALKKSIYNH